MKTSLLTIHSNLIPISTHYIYKCIKSKFRSFPSTKQTMTTMMVTTSRVSRPFLITARKWHKEAMKVRWEKPETGWTKLNYDGSCKYKTGKSSIGGIFRDDRAGFVLGYAESIGQSNSTIAEVAALVRGLEIALDNGWTQVWLEGDSKSVVDIIAHKREARCKRVQNHVERINIIIPQIEKYLLTHTYREGNRAADKFAQMGHHLKHPQIWRQLPPNQLLRIVTEDAQGKTFLRRR